MRDYPARLRQCVTASRGIDCRDPDLLFGAANEIDELRNSLGRLYWQLHGLPVKHPQQADERAAARDLLDAAYQQRQEDSK